MPTGCEMSRRFRKCGRPCQATCQYCGRSFCEEHGVRMPDGQEVCSRSPCQAKKADIERHDEHKVAVAARNGDSHCGDASCEAQPEVHCAKCAGLYCLRHVAMREFDQRRGGTVIQVRGSVCDHCHKRRKVWRQA